MSIEKLDFDYVKQSQKSFTTFLNEVLQQLPSAVVLGVYVYLSSLPPTWVVNKQHLMNHFKLGRDKVGDILKWMNDNHLLSYERDRNPDGTLGKVAIVIKDGKDFIEHINAKKEGTTLLKTSSVVEVVDKSPTTLLKNQSVVKPECGKSAPTYNINNIKEIRSENKQKSFYNNADQKSNNLKKHGFAQSMDQMGKEKREIQKHEETKKLEQRTRMPDHLRQQLKKIKIGVPGHERQRLRTNKELLQADRL